MIDNNFLRIGYFGKEAIFENYSFGYYFIMQDQDGLTTDNFSFLEDFEICLN